MNVNKLTLTILAGILVLFSTTGCSNQDDSGKANEFVERSVAYEKQGQYRASLIEMRNAIQAEPQNVKFLIRYADLLNTIGSPNEAAELLLKRKDAIDQIRLPLASTLLSQGKFISAKGYLNSWTQNQAEQNEFDRLSALQLYMSGQHQEALDKYRTLVTELNTPLDTKFEFITLLIQDKRLTEAQEWVNKLQKDNPSSPDLMYANARIAYYSNNLDLAENQLTEALIYLPKTDILLKERLQVLELLSTVLTEQGKTTEALVYNKIIREANPDAFLAKQQYKDALSAASEGDLVTAKTAFEDILNQYPNNQQAALLLGLIHLEDGDVAGGEELLSQNLDAETAPVSIIQATALAQADQGKPEEAIAVLEKALLARPDDTTLLSLYGVISLNNGDSQKGIQSLSKALQLDPNRTRLHLLLAQYYTGNNQIDLALGHLRKAYAQNATDWATTGFYLTSLIKENETVETRKVLTELQTNFSSDPSAMWILAMADYQQGNIDSAKDKLIKLTKAEPSNLNVIVALANLYQNESKYELASGMWLKAIAINPANSSYVSTLISNMLQQQSAQQVTEWLLKEAKSNPELSLPLHAAAVELLVNQKQLPEANAIAAKYTNTELAQVKTMQANISRGNALLAAEKQDWDLALQNANKALEVLPDNINLVLLVAQIQLKQNNVSDAINTIQVAQQKQPGSARLINERAKILLNFESAQAAYDYMTPIWNITPSGKIAQTYIGLTNAVHPEKLPETIKALLAVDPNNVGGLTALAGYKLSNGETDEAIQLYEQVISINPNLVPALNNLAWLLSEKDVARALVHAKKAAELSPNSASVLDTYGWILHLSGNNTEAAKVLDRALLLDSENQEIQKHRKAI